MVARNLTHDQLTIGNLGAEADLAMGREIRA